MHPSHAKPWHMKEVQQLMKEQGVSIVEADQCMFGLKTWGRQGGKLTPATKPDKFMASSRVLGKEE